MDASNAGTPRRHLAHVFIECIRQRPDAVCQIDAATGEQETNASVLSRSIRLAKCLRKLGLKPGDVLSLGGRNHLDLFIPFYAGLLNGLPISGVDPYFKYDEIKSLLTITRPKILFCQQQSLDSYTKALKDLGLEAKIVTFDGKNNNLKQFIEEYGDDESEDEFQPAEFDTSKIFAFLNSTSGTTGGLKVAAFTHDSFYIKMKSFTAFIARKDNNIDSNITLHLSPIQWISAFINAMFFFEMKQIRLQTSRPDDVDHIIEMINKYRPSSALLSPALVTTLLHRKDDVDLTCFRVLNVTGSKAYPDTLLQLKSLLHRDARVLEPYGLTETIGPLTLTPPGTPLGSCGTVMPPHVFKLVDTDSGVEITEPHVTGELWTNGPRFTEYYNDPDATAAVLTEDGFYKTGDLLYRDKNNFYYFVDRIKSLIKYRNSHVLSAELERVILTHVSVAAVCVCGVPSREDGQRAAACVATRPGCRLSEQEIRDLVAEKLSKNKQLHGGVVFVDKLPMTSSGKVARGKVLELLKNSLRQ